VPGKPLPPRTPALVRTPALQVPVLDRPLSLNVRALPIVTLIARDIAGDPARNATVVLLPMPVGPSALENATHMFVLDAAGTARVRVEPGRWSVFVTDRIGFAHTVVEISAPVDLAMDLQELGVVRGRILTDGKPPYDEIQFVPGPVSFRATDVDAAAKALRVYGHRVNQWLATNTRLADDRTFELRFLDVGTTWSARVLSPRGAAVEIGRSSEPLEIDLREKREK